MYHLLHWYVCTCVCVCVYVCVGTWCVVCTHYHYFSIRYTPIYIHTHQVILLSATMPEDVLEVTKRFMRDPIRILVKKEELTLEGIKQFYVQVEKEVSTASEGDIKLDPLARSVTFPFAPPPTSCTVRERVQFDRLGRPSSKSG